MGQSATKLRPPEPEYTKSHRRKRSKESTQPSSKTPSRQSRPREPVRSRPDKGKAKAVHPRSVATKPSSSARKKSRKRPQEGPSNKPQRGSRQHRSTRTTSSATGLYIERPKKTNPAKSIPRENPAHRSTLSQKRRSSHRDPQNPVPIYTTNVTYSPDDDRPRLDCIVCAESKTTRHFPTRPPTAACTHEPQTCTRCLRQWITSEFEGKVWDHIDCPECRERLQHDDVQRFAPSAVFRRCVASILSLPIWSISED